MAKRKHVKFIERNFDRRSLSEIAGELGLTEAEVRGIARDLGLLKRPGFRCNWRVAILPACIAAYLLLAFSSLVQKSNTWDEISHLGSGYLYVIGNTLKNDEHPMFSKTVACLPLLLMREKLKPPQEFASFQPGKVRHRYWRLSSDVLYKNTVDATCILTMTRVAGVLWGVVLAVLAYAFAADLYGRNAGLLAAMLASFSPNLTAHARLITTDFPVTVFMFGTVLCFWCCQKRFGWGAAAAAGLFAGMAVCTKVSGALLAPICVVLGAVSFALPDDVRLRLGRVGAWLTRRPWWARRLAVNMLLFAVMAMVAYSVIWATYRFDFYSGEAGKRYLSQLVIRPPQKGPNLAFRCATFAHDHRLLPSHFIYAYSRVNIHNQRGHRTFLKGRITHKGSKGFFPLAILIKTPVAALILVAAALGLAVLDARKRGLRACVPDLFVLLPPLIFLAFAMGSKLNIGLRHVLPIYPFLFAFAARVAAANAMKRRLAQAAVGLLCCWYVGANLYIYPHYLAYFNELIGGPSQGDTYLVDSNLDWGQDLKGLKAYMDAHNIASVNLSYFGTADPDYYKINYRYLPSSMILNPKNPVRKIRLKGTYAISATMLSGAYFTPRQKGFKDFLQQLKKRYKPVTCIGHTIYIYRFD